MVAVNIEKSDLMKDNLLMLSPLLGHISTNRSKRQENSFISNLFRFLLVKNF